MELASRITPEYCWSEAERLLGLAVSAIDRASRAQLLEIAADYRHMAARLQSERADTPHSDETKGGDSGTA